MTGAPSPVPAPDAADAPLRLRHPIHRGSVLASALAFDLAHTDEATARRRILELSAQLDEVVRAGDVLIALLHTPLRVQSSAAVGAPLVRHGRLWTAAPLAPDELAALPAARAAVVLVAGGCARAHFLDELPREQLTAWLDLSMLECRFELESLGAPAAAPRLVLAEVQMEARRSLGVAPLAGEGQGLLRSLLDPAGAPGLERERAEDDASSPPSRGLASPLALLRGALAAFGSLFRRRAPAALPSGSFPSSYSSSRALAAAPPRRSWLRRAFGALGELSARALMRTQLRRVIGRRYARYLERVFEMFDGNQLDEALRHAIPLGGGVEDALRRLSLSLPAPRQSLALRPTPRGGGSSLDFGSGIYEALKARYRRAFERLRDQGDFEKAAFVLAELLHADEEAVSFLEQHGKLTLAAELAEARGLPAGLVIRQWFLARDRARALRLARRSGAFADAVTRLAASHPAEANALRLLWADELASAGAYPAAIDVVWPLVEARDLAADWLDRAIAIGGPTSARMLVRKARLLPNSFAEVRDRVLALAGDEELSRPTLEALATELLAEEPTPELRVLMRVAARRLLHELAAAERSGEGHVASGARSSSLLRLLELCGDPALRIDAAPILSSKKAAAREAGTFDAEEDTARRVHLALALRPQPLVLTWAEGDRGALPIFDALVLPDGKLLIALGELGAWLLARDGRVLTRFSEPAHRLVASDHGDRAIALAPRGEVMRLSRIDLLGKRARHWCDVAIDHFADEYDGAIWMVSRRDTVYAIEANAAGWQHAWKVDEAGATIVDLRRDAQFLSVWFARSHMEPRSGDATIPSSEPALLRFSVETTAEVWRYELPSLTLRRRVNVPLTGTQVTAGAVAPPGAVMAWLSRGAGEPTAEVLVGESWRRLPLRYAPLTAAISRLDAQWLVAAEPLELAEDAAAPDAPEEPGVGVALHLYDLSALACRAQLRLPGSRRAGARLQHQHLLVFDELGRLLVLSLQTGEIIRRLCVS